MVNSGLNFILSKVLMARSPLPVRLTHGGQQKKRRGFPRRLMIFDRYRLYQRRS
jgi:hypothetical protein